MGITGCDEEGLLNKHAAIDFTENKRMTSKMRSRQRSAVEEREYMILTKLMNSSLKKVAKSNFYRNLADQLKNNFNLKSQISKALGSHTHMPLVIYELGSIQFSFAHRLRFALALLLKEDFSHMINSLQVHISSINRIEVRVMKDMGCSIIIDDRDCMNYSIDKPTLLYLPYPNSETIANLVEENWFSSTRSNQIVILSNSLKDIVQDIGSDINEVHGKFEIASERLTQKYERLRYVWVVQKFCREIQIEGQMWKSYKQKYWGHQHVIGYDEESREQIIYRAYTKNWSFSTFGLHFFNLDCDTNLKALLPSLSSSIRLPRGCDFKAGNRMYLMDEENMVESSKLIGDIQDIMKNMEESDFYIYIRNQLKQPEIQALLSRMLGTEKNVQMVLYGIGSIEQDYVSQIQFALALLLKTNSSIPIGDIEIYSRDLTVADKKAMSDMGCKVLDLDMKNNWRRVKKPTFFFAYTADCIEMASIFEANFYPSRMNKICVFSSDHDRCYYEYCRGFSRHDRHLDLDHGRSNVIDHGYQRALMKHTHCFRVGKYVSTKNARRNMFLNFYVVDNDVDLYASLPRVTIRGMVKCHNIRDAILRDDYCDSVSAMHDYIKRLICSRFDGDDENNNKDSANDDNVNENDDDVDDGDAGDDDIDDGDDVDDDDVNDDDNNDDHDVIDDNFSDNDDNFINHIFNDGADDDDADDFFENTDYLFSRWPVKLRRKWNRPRSGWLKLNFSGNQESKGFGGVIHDEHGKILISYAGYIRDPKANAIVEALRHGSRCILTYFSNAKVVVEGDSLPVILRVNGLYHGDWRHEKALYEIGKARRGRKWAFVHVYPEANFMAEEMVVRGAQLRQTCHIWDHRGNN